MKRSWVRTKDDTRRKSGNFSHRSITLLTRPPLSYLTCLHTGCRSSVCMPCCLRVQEKLDKGLMLLQPEEESVNSWSITLCPGCQHCNASSAVSTPTTGWLQEHRDHYLPVLSTVADFQRLLSCLKILTLQPEDFHAIAVLLVLGSTQSR